MMVIFTILLHTKFANCDRFHLRPQLIGLIDWSLINFNANNYAKHIHYGQFEVIFQYILLIFNGECNLNYDNEN